MTRRLTRPAECGRGFGPKAVRLQEKQPHGIAWCIPNRRVLEDSFPLNIVNSDVPWQGAWWLIALAAAGSLTINPAWSLLQGCNQVAVVAKFNFWLALTVFSANALALICGAGIYASAVGALASLSVSIVYLLWRWRAFLPAIPGTSTAWSGVVVA